MRSINSRSAARAEHGSWLPSVAAAEAVGEVCVWGGVGGGEVGWGWGGGGGGGGGGGRESKSPRSRASAVTEAADECVSFVFGKEVHHSPPYSRSCLCRYVKLNHTVPPRVTASNLDCDREDVPRHARHHVPIPGNSRQRRNGQCRAFFLYAPQVLLCQSVNYSH
jgi:hypothetical protein